MSFPHNAKTPPETLCSTVCRTAKQPELHPGSLCLRLQPSSGARTMHQHSRFHSVTRVCAPTPAPHRARQVRLQQLLC